jgi:hypothetical protein
VPCSAMSRIRNLAVKPARVNGRRCEYANDIAIAYALAAARGDINNAAASDGLL